MDFRATQLRCSVAGGLAGAREASGGTRPQPTNVANAALVAFANNQAAAAKLHEAWGAEGRQLARGRRDLSTVKQQLMDPYQQGIARTLAEPKKAYEPRTQKLFAGKTHWGPGGFRKKGTQGPSF